jgi:hypothetical protein
MRETARRNRDKEMELTADVRPKNIGAGRLHSAIRNRHSAYFCSLSVSQLTTPSASEQTIITMSMMM